MGYTFVKSIVEIIQNYKKTVGLGLPGFGLLLFSGWWLGHPHAESAAASPQAAGNRPWVPLRIVDVSKVAPGEPFGGVAKVLYREEKDGKVLSQLLYIDWPPVGVPQPHPELGMHYHTFHEWGYFLGGDYITYEYIDPRQKHGELVQHRTGGWLSRPAYSLHDDGGQEGMERQGHSYILFFEEGDGPKDDVAIDPKSPRYKPDWKNVKQWTHPYRVQTLEQMEWEPDPELPGASVKYLSEDHVMGFRARLHHIPPKWAYPQAPEKSYYKQAHRFAYIIWGDMSVWSYESPNSLGTKVVAGKDFLIDQAPMSIWGFGTGPITEKGCMWLEVVYAKGTRVGGGPIETPVLLK
jgi:hypothetical protein